MDSLYRESSLSSVLELDGRTDVKSTDPPSSYDSGFGKGRGGVPIIGRGAAEAARVSNQVGPHGDRVRKHLCRSTSQPELLHIPASGRCAHRDQRKGERRAGGGGG